MSLQIKRIALTNFRKFRAPMVVEGLAPGLNIVIEPNEAGKSTLLEGLRAALFVRHGTRNQLAQSFAPHGDAVGPQTVVDFEVDGAAWTISKRFLKGASAELSGPDGRSQGDDAEAKLQQLLGFSRDGSHTGDPAMRGALGLLWVAQAEALSLTAPSQLVRETVRGTLEAEVGTIMGGPAFEQVRQRIEGLAASYWTATGRPTGAQLAAREKRDAAAKAARAAEEGQTRLETTYADLEGARGKLLLVQREIADEADAQERRRLAANLDVAKGAAQMLETRRAEDEAARARATALEDVQQRHAAALLARTQAQGELEGSDAEQVSQAERLASAQTALAAARAALADERQAWETSAAAVSAARDRARRRDTAQAVREARGRLADAEALTAQLPALRELSAALIPADRLHELEEGETLVAAARARVEVGATALELTEAVAGLTLDGAPFEPGRQVLSGVARVGLGGGAELVIRPPAASLSARAELEEAERRRDALRSALGVVDLAAARQRNDDAREAAAEVRTVEARLAGFTPADGRLGLSAGIEALRAWLADVSEVPTAGLDEEEGPSIEDLERGLDEARSAVARAEGAHDGAVEQLREAEQAAAPLAASRAALNEKLRAAQGRVTELEAAHDLAALPEASRLAREAAAAAAGALAEAQRNAAVHDAEAIARRIESIDARTRGAQERRQQLEREISRLEAIVDTEGGKGLAERAATLTEEAEAAAAALTRVEAEAETLKLLKDTLEQARSDTSQAFVGPVARRAKRHIHRLLPGCDLTFSEDLGLQSILRGGVSEGCSHLSKGTQEQLAVLTRLAFADLLLDDGRPVSLILDDPLVYSDDARLDLMTDILTDAAERMQVILLTCRERAFRHLTGTKITVAAAADPPAAAGGV